MLLATLSSFARAQEIDSLKSCDIEEVVVVGSAINKEVVPVQALSSEELRRLSTHSIADAMRYFSGAQIKDYGGVGGLKTINVRSMGSNHVGLFFDGMQVGNAQNGVVDLGRFSLDNVESVSMYNGQKSAIFQSAKDYASSSAIYMVTRKPQFQQGKPYNINIGIKGGSFRTINPSLLWEQRLSDKVRSSLSAEYMYTSGEYPFTYSKQDGYDTTALRQNGDVRYLRTEAALFGELNKGEWQAKAYWYNSERGYPGASIREEPGAFRNADRQWDNNLFVQGSLRKMFTSWYSFKAQAKYADDFLHYLSDPRLDASTMHIDNRYRQREAYSSIINLFDVAPWLNMAVATDFQYNTLDSDMTNFVYPKRYTSLSSVAASFNYNRFKAQASMLYTYVHDVVGAVKNNSTEDLSRFTPTLVLSYKPLEQSDLNLRAFYKRVFRMPTLNDLYYTFVGNINLDPEYTTQYNIGATYRQTPNNRILKGWELQADAYYNQVKDKIVAMPTSNQFRWTMINLGYVEIRGVDLTTQAHLQFGELGITPRLSYTYQKAQDFTDPTSKYYGGQIPYVPWHSGSAIIGADLRGWALNYSFIYTGERYEAVANIAENYSLPWYTSDLSIAKSFTLNGLEMRLTAEVNNILNQQYEVVQCYPMPGVNYKLKLNITL